MKIATKSMKNDIRPSEQSQHFIGHEPITSIPTKDSTTLERGQNKRVVGNLS